MIFLEPVDIFFIKLSHPLIYIYINIYQENQEVSSMADIEFPGKSLVTSEKCKGCGRKPAVFLHHVMHKGDILRICTSCVLQLNKGLFCPICFFVYDDQFNLSEDNHFKCTCCENAFHISCIQSGNCPYCGSGDEPNKKIFEFSRDELNNGVEIDKNSAPQLLAAALISKNSMRKAAKIASVRAQIMCKEATDAKNEAKNALYKVDDLDCALEDTTPRGRG